MNDMVVWFNSNLGGPVGSIIGAIAIFIIGWFIAMALGAVVRSLLSRLNVNQRMNTSTGKSYDIENIIAKVVFWFVFLMAISGALSRLSLTTISAPFANMINSVLAFIPSLVGAVAIGVIGWVIATMARSAINMGLARTTLDERLSAQAGVRPMSSTIADMVYWVILLFVLVMVLGQLKLEGLFAPLASMLSKMLDFIPNIILAGIVFFVGYIIAQIVRSIAAGMVASLNLQGFAEKAGISNDRENSLPNLAGSVAFLLVIIPTAITALDTLKIEVISRPATNMLDKILDAIPNIVAAVAIFVITYYVMKMVANVVKNLLEDTSINNLPKKVGFDSAMGDTKVSDLVSYAIMFFAMLFAGILAANLLGFVAITAIITMFISFAANIILGAIILFIGFWLANIIAGVVERSEQGSKFLASIIRVLIMGLVLAMGLKAMGIADSIVNLAFGLTLGAVAVAFALAFGLGGREAAARLLRKMQDKIDEERTGLKVETTRHTTTTSTPATTTSATTVTTPVVDVEVKNTKPSSDFSADDLK